MVKFAYCQLVKLGVPVPNPPVQHRPATPTSSSESATQQTSFSSSPHNNNTSNSKGSGSTPGSLSRKNSAANLISSNTPQLQRQVPTTTRTHACTVCFLVVFRA